MSVFQSGRCRGAVCIAALRVFLAASGGLFLGAPALAQAQGRIAAVEPYYVVTTGDDAVLRCGNLDTFYIVANLRAGQLLRVDGESENWKRVAYPAGTTVFVAADDVQVSADGKTATLTRPSNLKAANAGRAGLKGSWKNVFDPTPLPAGTRLTIVKAEQTDDGKRQAFRVEPPEGARAFIHNGYVRRATDAEIAGAGLAPAPAAGAATTPRVEPTIAPAQEPSTDAAEADPVPPTEAPGWTPAPGPAERPVATPEQLNSAFEQVRRQPAISAELDELIVEYQRAIDARSDSESDRRIVQSLRQRLEWLRLRKDLQAQLIALEEARQAVSRAGQDAATEIAEVNKTRRYEVIGRLTTSTVYDGKRLPLMYRVQSVGDPVPRTLGYLRPDERLELEKKIGQIVGVSGESSLDKALKLNVLTAKRVDVLSPQREVSVPDTQ